MVLSVVVANYNNAHYLPECLNSIMAQSFKDFEVVVSDDCSTDNSKDVILDFAIRYPDKFVTVFQKKNKGIAFNRHSAILQARGEYITTLDSDDYFADETKLEKEMALVMEYKQKYNEDIIAFSNILRVFNDGRSDLMGNDKNIVHGHILNHIMTRSCMIPRDFIFARKLYFEVGGYDFKFLTHEDWDLKIRLSYNHKYYYSGVTGTAYRNHGSGLSSTPHKLRTRNLKTVFKKNIHLIGSASERVKVKQEFNHFMNLRNNQRYNSLKTKFFSNQSLKPDFFQKIKFCKEVFQDMGFPGLRLIKKPM